MKTIGLIGNPNCGKTTVFNGLTGSHQHIGNWPGVTVEKKEGDFALPKAGDVKIVDLPGIYSLTAASEDEKASLEYVLSHEADLYINVIDATAIERNLYLTLLMCELKVPMVIVVTMMDIARQRRTVIDLDHFSKHLGVPVIGVNATDPKDIAKLRVLLDEAAAKPKVPRVPIEFPNELEQEIDILASASVKTAEHYKVDPRWVAMKAIEGDPLIRRQLERHRDMAPEVIDGTVKRCSEVLGDPPDVVLAETRYGVIAGLVKDVVRTVPDKVFLSEKIDKFVINRFLGILNTIGTDGSIGNEDSEKSLLSVVGRSITPVFEPIGVEKDNWQASVSIFTGLFAKEAVIGTLNGLYGQDDAQRATKTATKATNGESASAEEKEEYSLIGGLKEAFASIPATLADAAGAIFDPLGFSGAAEDVTEGEEKEANEATINGLKKHFTKGFHQAFAFLLFVLLYVPCIAATGTVFREVGKGYGIVFVAYLTTIGWSVATIYHALMVSHSSLWFSIGAGILAAMFGFFWAYGKKHRVDMI